MKQPILTLFALALLLLAGALFLPDQPPPAAASSHTDLDRLRDLYSKTGGPTHWAQHCKEQWDYQFDDETTIVTLGAGRVTALRLDSCGLVGPIPQSMMGLTRLQVLNLANNSLSGSIPKEIGNLSDLVQLDLSNNRLDGPIPPQLGNIPNLEILNLENNQLSGELPPQLNNLVHLTELRLNRNFLRGEIPNSFDNLGFVEILRLQETSPSRRSNQLWGCLRLSPGDPQTGIPYCQEGRLPPPTPTPTPRPTPVRFPTPTYTPVPTYTPRPTWTPVPTWTPIPTATPVINPEVNLTAARQEVPAGQPIELTLTLKGHPRQWRSMDTTLRAPDGITLDSDNPCPLGRCTCTSNLCSYHEEFHPGEGHHTLKIKAIASEPGEFTFNGEALWFDDESDNSAPFKQPFATTVTVLPPEDPDIRLHATQTEGVRVGNEVSLTLVAQNPLGRPPMRLNLTLPAPDGWSITRLDQAESCHPNQCSGKYTVDKDQVRHIAFGMQPNQSGQSTVNAFIQWYFEDDPINVKNERKTLAITVVPAPTPTPSPIPTPSAAPADTPPPALPVTATPNPTPLPTPAPTVAAAPPAPNPGGGCNAYPEGPPLNGSGDFTLLGLSLLGLVGWTVRRRKP